MSRPVQQIEIDGTRGRIGSGRSLANAIAGARFALAFGVAWSLLTYAWNVLRQLGGENLSDPNRWGSESGAAILAGLGHQPMIDLVAKLFQMAGGSGEFEGEVKWYADLATEIWTGMARGIMLFAAVEVGYYIAASHGISFNAIIEVGYFTFFICMGGVIAVGQLSVGREAVVKRPPQIWPRSAKEACDWLAGRYFNSAYLLKKVAPVAVAYFVWEPVFSASVRHSPDGAAYHAILYAVCTFWTTNVSILCFVCSKLPIKEPGTEN